MRSGMQIRIIEDGQEVHREVSSLVEIAIADKDSNPLRAAVASAIATILWERVKREGGSRYEGV